MAQKISCILLFTLFFALHATSQIVWNGPAITFTKPAFANSALPENQDRITAFTWITRGASQGLYNAASEASYKNNLSPANTEWASGTLANYASLTYEPWEVWAGGPSNIANIVGKSAVVHLIKENIYLSVTFLSWGVRPGSGASFAYQRTTAPIPAPVKLSHFSVARKNNTLHLNWKTASEQNTASFSIERSSDGKQFTEIGTIPAAGNSTAERHYSFLDAAPLPVSFYRLRTNDLDGYISYSAVVAHRVNGLSALQLFPNPVSNVLHLQWSAREQTEALITDLDGRVIKRFPLPEGSRSLTIETGELKPGVYFIQAGDERKQFVKQ